jgi:hypothetical protein
MAKYISPIIFAAAHYDNFKVVYHLTERQLPRDDHNAGNVFSGCQPISYMIAHGPVVMCDENASFARSPG